MLPLKASVDALQNALRNSNRLVRALPSFHGRLEDHDTGLILEKLANRLDVELPEFRHLGRSVVSFSSGGCLDQAARSGKYGRHRYLAPLSDGCLSGRCPVD
jgi:hypothetical protein